MRASRLRRPGLISGNTSATQHEHLPITANLAMSCLRRMSYVQAILIYLNKPHSADDTINAPPGPGAPPLCCLDESHSWLETPNGPCTIHHQFHPASEGRSKSFSTGFFKNRTPGSCLPAPTILPQPHPTAPPRTLLHHCLRAQQRVPISFLHYHDPLPLQHVW